MDWGQIVRALENFWEQVIKTFIYSVWIATIAIISPISYAYYALAIIWLTNFFMGMKTDKKVNNKEFDIKKAFDSLKQAGFIGVVTFIAYYTPHLMGDEGMARSAVKGLTYTVCYWYLANIFKNAKLYWPNQKEMDFIYQVLSTQILSNIRILTSYYKNKPNNEKEEPREEETK